MNKWILLLSMVLAIGSCAPVNQVKKKPDAIKKSMVKKQVTDTVLFKGVNKVLIENDKSSNQNLFLLQAELVKRGYGVQINRRLFTISTRDSIIEGGKVAYVLNGRIDSNHVELSGKYNSVAVTSIMGESSHVFQYDINYSGSEKGLPKKMFARLMEIVNNLQGKKTYVNETRKRRGALL